MILNDVVKRLRKLVYDQTATYRWDNETVLDAFNDGVRDIKTRRPDLRYDNDYKFETEIPQYTLPDDWTATTAKEYNDRVKQTTGDDDFFFICRKAGTTGGAEPTWTYIEDEEQTDGTVSWVVESITLPDQYERALAFFIASVLYGDDDDEVGDANKSQYYEQRYLSAIGVL